MQGGNAVGHARWSGGWLPRGVVGAWPSLVAGWVKSARSTLLGLLGLAVLLPCVVGASAAWAQNASTSPAVQAGRPEHRELLAQELVPTQPGRYAWPRAAEAQRREADAIYLRLALLDEWVLALEGRPRQSARTIEAAIAQGRGIDADELHRRARAVWPAILKAQLLRPQWDMDGPGAPLPSELDAFGADIAQEGPGLWVHRAKDGRPRGLYLWVGVRNGLSEPVPLPEFALRLGRPGQRPAAPLLQCYLPRYSTRQLVLAQSTEHYLCRAAEGSFEVPPRGVGWLAQMGDWYSQGAALETVLPQQDQALSRTGRILEQIDSPAVDGFLRGARDCEAEGNCAQPADSATTRRRAAAEAAALARSQARAQAPARNGSAHSVTPPWLKRLMFWGGTAGVLVLYVLMAYHVSVVAASVLLWMGLAIPSAMFLRSLWATSWADSWGGIGAIPLSMVAAGAPFLGTFMAYGLYQLLTSAKARRNAIMFLLVVLAIIVLNALEHWLL